jgi:ATP phosphoribosyltransferase
MIRLALPTGELRADTAAALTAAGLPVPDYAAGSRALRFEMCAGSAVARVFRERDIPVQVAMGNYDLGICQLAWTEELIQRFPSHQVVVVRDLGYGAESLWLAAASDAAESSVRIVSEYPNIAHTLARRMRLPRYRVFPVLGAGEAYPPEDADVALIAAPGEAGVERHGLRPLARVLRGSVCLIANSRSLATKDLSSLLAPLVASGTAAPIRPLDAPDGLALRSGAVRSANTVLRIALPDGHAQRPTVEVLRAAGVAVEGYDEREALRRPRVALPQVEAKVIRPQDMPQQVAIGNFDLAVTGRDVLFDHLVQFPSSPVEEVLDLKRSRYSLAVIVKDVRADTVAGAVAEWRASSDRPIRIASEYPNIADHFARERHFGRYSVIPIAGASEGFVPDDADVLIEGIDTGSSVRANNLTVLERFFESTNCLIANKRRPEGALRRTFDRLVEQLRAGVADAMPAGTA